MRILIFGEPSNSKRSISLKRKMVKWQHSNLNGILDENSNSLKPLLIIMKLRQLELIEKISELF